MTASIPYSSPSSQFLNSASAFSCCPSASYSHWADHLSHSWAGDSAGRTETTWPRNTALERSNLSSVDRGMHVHALASTATNTHQAVANPSHPNRMPDKTPWPLAAFRQAGIAGSYCAEE